MWTRVKDAEKEKKKDNEPLSHLMLKYLTVWWFGSFPSRSDEVKTQHSTLRDCIHGNGCESLKQTILVHHSTCPQGGAVALFSKDEPVEK